MSTFKSALTALTLLASVAALKTNNTEHSNCTEQKPAPSIKPLRKWDWLQTSYHGALQQQAAGEKHIQGPMQGFAVGNWLLLEPWMSEPWFNATADHNASIVDEWTLSEYLGDRALPIFEKHWDTWVTEEQIETLHQAGLNMCRIPVGFWAFIAGLPGEPYLFQAGQIKYIDRLLGWLYKRGIYAILDIHGMPGGQNAEMTTGRKNPNFYFFTPEQMARADDTVDAVLAWYDANPYRSIIAAFGIVNEPRPADQAEMDMLEALYARTYAKSSTLKDPLTIQFHHGYVHELFDVDRFDYWTDFLLERDPVLVMIEDHPYPGNFPARDNATDILEEVCRHGREYENFPAPVGITEWCIRTGITVTAFEREFYARQIITYAQAGGGVFWNHLTTDGHVGWPQYSFLDAIPKGSIPLPEKGQSQLDYLKSLGNPCGEPKPMSWARKPARKPRKHGPPRLGRSHRGLSTM